jgi:hypothetical protein
MAGNKFNHSFKYFYTMKKNIIIIITCMLCLACGEDNVNNPRGSTEVPLQVTVTDVIDINGASIIYYDCPDDKNLKYVKAVWVTDDGIEYSQTASFYTDSILVDGFGSEGTYTVNLYSVSTGETPSQPVKVSVNPKRPPYLVAYDKMRILPNFMGIRVLSENETGARLDFRTFKKDTLTNEYVEVGTEYLVSPNIEYYNRGHAADTLQYFRVQIRDRWGHWSPPKDTAIIPWFEITLPKAGYFAEVRMCRSDLGPSDDGSPPPENELEHLPSNYWGHRQHVWGGSMGVFTQLFNGIVGGAGECYHSSTVAPLPAHFTIDLGAQYTLSRMLLWPRNDAANLFRGGHPQIVHVYGASYNGSDWYELVDDINDAEAWLDLGLFYFSRADGSFDPYPSTGYLTSGDNAILANGHEMILKSIDQKIRYIRVQTIKCFSVNTASNAVMIGEITLFGSDK